MRLASGSLLALPVASVLAFALSGCGVFMPTMKAHDELAKKNDELAKTVEQQRQETLTLRADLEATRTRLDNALRAQADSSTDQLSDRAKLQNIEARLDGQNEFIELLKKDVAATRREIDTRLDEMKRAQEAPGKPPLVIPQDRPSHYAAIEAAMQKQDWSLARTYGREYTNRYVEDDKADDAQYLVGDAFLKEGRPAAALGEFNQLLKMYPKSNQLGPTLYAMGEAYLALKDCTNAKLAFATCESRFRKEPIGAQAKQKVALINKPTPGMCTP